MIMGVLLNVLNSYLGTEIGDLLRGVPETDRPKYLGKERKIPQTLVRQFWLFDGEEAAGGGTEKTDNFLKQGEYSERKYDEDGDIKRSRT